MDYCQTCVYYPPSSCDGKPCTQCEPENPFLSCYREKEFVLDAYKECKPTNADRIRAMTDEELAEMITSMLSERDKIMLKKLYDFGIYATLVEDLSESFEYHLNWLKQESENLNDKTD